MPQGGQQPTQEISTEEEDMQDDHMGTIEVSASQKALFEELAQEEGLSVGDYLFKAVRSVEWFIKTWDLRTDEDELPQEPLPEDPEEDLPVDAAPDESSTEQAVAEEESTPRKRVPLVIHVGACKMGPFSAGKDALAALVEFLGPMRVLQRYSGTRSLLKARLARSDRRELYRKVKDAKGGPALYMYDVWSRDNVKRIASQLAEDLGKEIRVEFLQDQQ